MSGRRSCCGKGGQPSCDLLAASRDGGIPRLSRAHPGTEVDVAQFRTMTEELARRDAAMLGGASGGTTLTVDARQSSAPNSVRLAASGLHIVGSVAE